MNKRNKIAKRAAKELKDGMVVNLGFGIPILAANYVDKGVNVILQSENGILNYGTNIKTSEGNPFFCAASGEPVAALPGCSIFTLDMSFLILRGGHVDMTILGALEVDSEGSIANWATPYGNNKYGPGMGGAIDILVGTKKVVVTMTHKSKNGEPKIREKCSMPLSAVKAVDLIITDEAVVRVTDEGLLLEEIAQGLTVDEVVKDTEAKLIISDNLKVSEIL
ncbi:3-oxoacid CoA-transferase subunit B [Clostridium luticellarii]|jgi:3-oxoacid CoA-transferase subunit B/acetate CoA/acetoacetate CoA-transferase beta subunit|uniref:Acetate CoA-transferase subunit beta n=1 Tax=Clostridium luticellarii TaxID=1691940 RepID=A0A2T0BSA4_9CLOT|nr:3-oxoacid CoA-transferase subunit B [Clostridium luticellarii]MCI1945559.1 3-oxoacid CoA-transferase subunit B [Clostridium luticellarii]MCI1968882.1 3-oxoacid CoA-transferase subunit B [Clostridium luticellarii]MCI1996503.1 3-oxoacid CoA-transferase subunit B [Clostridium luticellarii]MCI2041055.1 3-oxoacid CoA-transferase subunit B [Clostridium luticellarii]PRR86786.1 Acetate CoA-transferase subunit beta [Clostridium luticellarii]